MGFLVSISEGLLVLCGTGPRPLTRGEAAGIQRRFTSEACALPELLLLNPMVLKAVGIGGPRGPDPERPQTETLVSIEFGELEVLVTLAAVMLSEFGMAPESVPLGTIVVLMVIGMYEDPVPARESVTFGEFPKNA